MRTLPLGHKVYNKRTLNRGKIVKFDDDAVYIDVDSIGIKCVTWSNYERWWELDIDEQEEVSAETIEDCDTEENVEPVNTSVIDVYNKFISIVKSYNDEDIMITYKTPTHSIVKCNGKAIFDITICKKKIVVYAHPQSLTPDNMRRVNKLYPKDWNRSLRAKFIFVSTEQSPLMKTIISDGVFYRKNI